MPSNDLSLDDLKNAWHLESARLDSALRLGPVLAAGRLLDRAERSLLWLALALWGGVVVHAAAILWIGSWVARHLGEPHLFIAGVIVHVAAILLLISRIVQLVALRALDWTAPVIHIQRRIATLRRTRLRILQWTLLLSPLLWMPLSVVLAEALFGIDLVAVLPAEYWLVSLVVGLVAIPLGLLIARHTARKLEGSESGRRLLTGLAGPQLAAAEDFLSKLDAFVAPVGVSNEDD